MESWNLRFLSAWNNYDKTTRKYWGLWVCDSHNLRLCVRSDVYVNIRLPCSTQSPDHSPLLSDWLTNRPENLTEQRYYKAQVITLNLTTYNQCAGIIAIYVYLVDSDSRYQGCLWPPPPPPVFLMITNSSLLLTRASLILSGRVF